jgi:predicted component of type VI protein secretion system
MDVVLIVERARTPTKKIRLRKEATVIGRRRDCTLCIPSAEVSRRHCILQYQDGYVTVEDLDSVNGTFLNGIRIASKEVVYPGDRLAVGPMKFIVQYQLSQSAKAMLQATSPAEKAFDFGSASEPDGEPPTVKVQPGDDVKVVPHPGGSAQDFEIVHEIEEADLVEEIEDAELIDAIEKPEAGLVEIVEEPEDVEIIDDPGAVEIVEDPQAVEVVSDADVVEIIDNPEVVEGSSLMKARESAKENIPVVKKKTPPGKDRR